MQITLTDSGPPMWFLGEPKNLIASLTFANPGPQEIDFEKLDKPYQLKILNAIKEGILESDVSFQDLFQTATKGIDFQPRKISPEDVPVEEKPILSPIAQQRMAMEIERTEKEKKFEERCDFILKGSITALKTSLAGETDSRLVRTLFSKEQAGQQRLTVLKFLKEKLKKIENNIAKQIAKDTQKQLDKIEQAGKKETSVFTVIESEQKTIVLTPEDLVRLTVPKR